MAEKVTVLWPGARAGIVHGVRVYPGKCEVSEEDAKILLAHFPDLKIVKKSVVEKKPHKNTFIGDDENKED